MPGSRLIALAHDVAAVDGRTFMGRVTGLNGLLIEAAGPAEAMGVGGRARIGSRTDGVRCEIIGFREGRGLLLPLDPPEAIRPGLSVFYEPWAGDVAPCQAWLSRIVDAFGAPIDGQGPLPKGSKPRRVRAGPPPAHARARVGARMELGVRALDTFAACCRGQRLGIFAGSGVGKSVLLSMLARNAAADVIVIGLIGERGREVNEFLEETLGPEGLARSVIVVATSDEPAARRRQAAYMTLAVAEHFRDEGKDVLLLMDSVTRFAMAGREIGLASGEPPTTKGYTPTVFAELPRLMERAGPGLAGQPGSITALFTVLVDGDDHNEPIADAARGILDGHIVMERAIAERGRYPAVNVLKSVSRTMPACHSEEENALVRQARRALSLYSDMEELIRIGAYKHGSDPELDEAIRLKPALESFLSQRKDEATPIAESFARLSEALQ